MVTLALNHPVKIVNKMVDIESLCRKVCEIAISTGNFIRNEAVNFDIKDARSKGTNDFVSYVDFEAERLLVEKLSEILPEAGFITEEETSDKRSESYQWVIDPLDGTTNFVHGLPPYSISIALTDVDDILLGVILEINSKELFYAWKDGGAWLNGEKVYVSQATEMKDTLVATGFPFKEYSNLNPYMDCLEYFIRNTHGVRRMGSAAIDLAYVSCGRFDAFFESGLNPWDVSAGILLIREAGGKASDFSGVSNKLSGHEIVAANGYVFDDFRKIVNRFMKDQA